MSRSFYQTEYHTSFAEVRNCIENALHMEGYHPYLYRNAENVWKRGTGAMTAMGFIKVEYDVGKVTIQGWICAGLGSVELNEMGLTGGLGVIPKKAVKGVIERTIQKIR